ncbi:MAG: 30S ribosomal protein S24e [Candidatus Hodarchaeota archaeon]
MKIDVTSEKMNPLLGRREVYFEISHSKKGSPMRLDIREELASKYKVDQDFVFIRKLMPVAGKQRIKGIARIYDDKDRAVLTEAKHIIIRNQPKAEEKMEVKEEKPEEKPQEKPKKKPEEKPEEKPQEKPKKKVERKTKEG